MSIQCPECGKPPRMVSYLQLCRCSRGIYEVKENSVVVNSDEDSEIKDETDFTFECTDGHTWHAKNGELEW